MRFITYGNYIYLPILASCFWLVDLIGLIALWVKDGKPDYDRGDVTVVFISDVGARYKTFFIIFSALTAAFYIATMFAERLLRHADRLPNDIESPRHKRQRLFDILAIIFACIGSAALVVLSILDDVNHSTVHWSMTVVFVLCVAISAVFQTLEIIWLHRDHPDRRHLMRNSILKMFIVGLAIALAIAFAATYGVCRGRARGQAPKCRTIASVAGALEWTIAFVLWLYFLSLILDLWPAAKTSPRHIRRHERHLREKGLLAAPAAVAAGGSGNHSPSGTSFADPRMSMQQHGHEPVVQSTGGGGYATNNDIAYPTQMQQHDPNVAQYPVHDGYVHGMPASAQPREGYYGQPTSHAA